MANIEITELEGFCEFSVERENESVETFKAFLKRWNDLEEEEIVEDLLEQISMEEGCYQPILSILTYGNPYKTAQLTIFITMSEIDGLWTLWSMDKEGNTDEVKKSSNLRELEELGFFSILDSIV